MDVRLRIVRVAFRVAILRPITPPAFPLFPCSPTVSAPPLFPTLLERYATLPDPFFPFVASGAVRSRH